MVKLAKNMVKSGMMVDLGIYAGFDAPTDLDNFEALEDFHAAVWECTSCGSQLTDPASALCDSCFFSREG
jgi:hypothetical protein